MAGGHYQMKESDQEIIGTDFVEVQGLSVPAEYFAPGQFVCVIFYEVTGTGTGAKFKVGYTETFEAGNFRAQVGGGGLAGALNDISASLGANIPAGNYAMLIGGGYIPSSPAGMISFNFAQNVGGQGGSVIVKKISWIRRDDSVFRS